MRRRGRDHGDLSLLKNGSGCHGAGGREGAAYAENGFVCDKLICNVNGLFGVIFVIVNFNNDLTTINAAGFVVDLSHQLCRISQRNAILGGISGQRPNRCDFIHNFSGSCFLSGVFSGRGIRLAAAC